MSDAPKCDEFEEEDSGLIIASAAIGGSAFIRPVVVSGLAPG